MANQPKGFSEFIRKRIVALKRKPQTYTHRTKGSYNRSFF